jgi:4-hydroxy-tetrahydrodipicolinate synthase
MPAETTIKLSHVDNIVGTKEAAGNFEQVANIVQESAEGFRVWSGDDKDTVHVLAVGGYGVVSVASHVVGSQIKKMIELFVDGKTSSAADIHRHLLPLFSALFIVTNPIPVKHALNFYGYSVGLPRLPLVAPDSVTAAEIESVLMQYSTDLANVWTC